MKLRLLSYIVAALLAIGPAQSQSQLLLGAGKPSATAPADCSAFLPANFATSALYISWTTADGLGSFGKACLNGTTPVAASTLGAVSGAASVGASGLSCPGSASAFWNFTDVTWMTQNSGTLYLNYNPTGVAGTQYAWNLSDGTLSNFVALRLQATATMRGIVDVGGSLTTASPAFTSIVGTPAKFAYSYTAGTQIIYAAGTNTATTNAASTPPSLTTAHICASPTASSPLAGTVTETAFFSTALNAGTTPTLQAITQ